MKKNFLTAAVTAMMLMGVAGGAFAQSDAMEEANKANDEPLKEGSGVTSEGDQVSEKASGHSDAANQSMDAVESETSEKTNTQKSEDLDEINAEGHSDAESEAIKSQ